MKPSTDRAAIKQIIKGMLDAGVSLDSVYDCERDLPVETAAEAVDLIMNLDMAYLYVTLPDETMAWVLFVLDNAPEEVAADFTVNLSDILDPIIDPWWE